MIQNISFLYRVLIFVVLISSLCAVSNVEMKIKKLGHTLPQPSTPKGSYVSYVNKNNVVYLSGHLPIPAVGPLVLGRLGENLNLEEGNQAAKLVGLQLISTLKDACGGDLDRVRKIVKITGFVNSANDFTSQPGVINGCSDLLVEVFGKDIGSHARSAVGVNVLPLGVPVEIEAIVEIEPEINTHFKSLVMELKGVLNSFFDKIAGASQQQENGDKEL